MYLDNYNIKMNAQSLSSFVMLLRYFRMFKSLLDNTQYITCTLFYTIVTQPSLSAI